MTTTGLTGTAFAAGQRDRVIRREQAAKRANARRVARQRAAVAVFRWVGAHLPEAAVVGRAFATLWYWLLAVAGVGVIVYGVWQISHIAAYLTAGVALILPGVGRRLRRFVMELASVKARDHG